jgi:glycine/serine hydroxymethyltransferase
MREVEMVGIARLIGEVLTHLHDEAKIRAVREEVRALCDRFPLYRERIAKG